MNQIDMVTDVQCMCTTESKKQIEKMRQDSNIRITGHAQDNIRPVSRTRINSLLCYVRETCFTLTVIKNQNKETIHWRHHVKNFTKTNQTAMHWIQQASLGNSCTTAITYSTLRHFGEAQPAEAAVLATVSRITIGQT